MKCAICKEEFYTHKKNRRICGACRADRQKVKEFYNRRRRKEKRTCCVCGAEFKPKGCEHTCAVCGSPEKKAERRLAQRMQPHPCVVCKKPVSGCAIYCSKACRTKKRLQSIHENTLDITLFFMIVRGLGVAESAAEQNIEPRTLKGYLKRMAGTQSYRELRDYYARERVRRQKRLGPN